MSSHIGQSANQFLINGLEMMNIKQKLLEKNILWANFPRWTIITLQNCVSVICMVNYIQLSKNTLIKEG